MKVFRDLNELTNAERHGALAIGNFDGVHRGHAAIIERLLAKARQVRGPAVVFTFDPHPAHVLRPDRAPRPLMWTDRKVELLTEFGVDAVIAYPTNEAFLRIAARQFFDEIVIKQLAARAMVEGSNFFFGHDRRGNVEVLGQFCREAGVSLEVVEPLRIDGHTVSSSLIRSLVAEGQVDRARRMLTGPYRIRGRVGRGAGRGRGLGFPTANLDEVETVLPGEGIYAGRSLIDGRPWPTAISLGPNPTFDEGIRKVEAYLIGYNGALYDRYIEVDFLARLRDIQRFGSVGELVAQMDRDAAAAREIAQQQE